MQSIETDQLEAFTKSLDHILSDIPDKRRELHERLGEFAQAEVRRQISAGGINDSHGTVRGWQAKKIGSGGGYAAVRARKSNGTESKDSPGAITNYLENGHKTRHPNESTKRKNKKIRRFMAYVSGRHFYKAALDAIEKQALAEAKKLVDQVCKKLGG